MSVSSLAHVYAPMSSTTFANLKSNKRTRTYLNQSACSFLHVFPQRGHCSPLQPTEAVLVSKCRRNDAKYELFYQAPTLTSSFAARVLLRFKADCLSELSYPTAFSFSLFLSLSSERLNTDACQRGIVLPITASSKAP